MSFAGVCATIMLLGAIAVAVWFVRFSKRR